MRDFFFFLTKSETPTIIPTTTITPIIISTNKKSEGIEG
ncbi:hypothetical protein ES703_28635 [subsurface metagenome]